jgi:hypothetical protein
MALPIIKLNTPKKPTPSAVEDGLLPASEACPRWFYSHSSTYAFDMETRQFLPELNEQRIVAGVSGVREIRNGNGDVIGVDDNALRAGLLRSGATILDPADPTLGPWRNYVRAYPCVGGGKCWVFSTDRGGVTFTLLGNGRAVPQPATEVFREFKVWLIENGKIPQISKPVYDQMLDLETNALNRAIRRATSNPHLRARVEEQEEKIAAMRKAWAKLDGDDVAPVVGTLSAPVAP